MSRKHANNRMQKKPNDFGLQYGNQKHYKKAKWINNMTKESEGLEESTKVELRRFTQNNTKKYQTGKRLAMMKYIDSGSRNSPHLRQTSTRNEHMPTRTTRTWMDDQRKYHIDQRKGKQRKCSKQLQTITCLLMMWKILTAQIREEIYYLLTSRRGFSPVEQKGSPKGSRGTAELLYID